MSKIIALVGCSASGKDTLLKELVSRYRYIPIISTTSRPKRKGEKEGVEYHFLTKEQVEEELKQNKFAEYRCYKVASGEEWLYGIRKQDIKLDDDNIYVMIVDVDGLIAIRNYVNSAGYKKVLTGIYIDCSGYIRLRRSLEREGIMSDMQVTEVCRRFLDDMVKVDKRARGECNLIIKNNDEDDFEKNVKLFKELFGNKNEKRN